MQFGHNLFWLSIVSMFVPLFLIALLVGGLWGGKMLEGQVGWTYMAKFSIMVLFS